MGAAADELLDDKKKKGTRERLRDIVNTDLPLRDKDKDKRDKFDTKTHQLGERG